MISVFQPSWWFPTQNNAAGGCQAGCLSTFSQQGIGLTLNVSFSYDKNDNISGAKISAGIDQSASFIGPSGTITRMAFCLVWGLSASRRLASQ